MNQSRGSDFEFRRHLVRDCRPARHLPWTPAFSHLENRTDPSVMRPPNVFSRNISTAQCKLSLYRSKCTQSLKGRVNLTKNSDNYHLNNTFCSRLLPRRIIKKNLISSLYSSRLFCSVNLFSSLGKTNIHPNFHLYISKIEDRFKL